MYYVTDVLYGLSNQVIWQGSPFISIMQVLAVDSDDFVALSTYSSSVVLLQTSRPVSIRVSLFVWGFLVPSFLLFYSRRNHGRPFYSERPHYDAINTMKAKSKRHKHLEGKVGYFGVKTHNWFIKIFYCKYLCWNSQLVLVRVFFMKQKTKKLILTWEKNVMHTLKLYWV